MSNVLGIRLDTVMTEQGPGLGGAILAAVGCGEFDSVEDACGKLIDISVGEEPDDALVKQYDKKYSKFVKLYPSLKCVFGDLATE